MMEESCSSEKGALQRTVCGPQRRQGLAGSYSSFDLFQCPAGVLGYQGLAILRRLDHWLTCPVAEMRHAWRAPRVISAVNAPLRGGPSSSETVVPSGELTLSAIGVPGWQRVT